MYNFSQLTTQWGCKDAPEKMLLSPTAPVPQKIPPEVCDSYDAHHLTIVLGGI